MIILDEEDDQHPKIASPLPLHVRTNRPATPTPSLPDYETSQEQLKHDLQKRRPLSKRLRWALWGLAAYFVVTIAIGVPLIVIKTRDSDDRYRQASLSSWFGLNDNSPLLPPIFNLATDPICLEEAEKCDDWSEQDIFDGTMFNSHLEYTIPVSPTMFVQSNMTFYDKNGTIPIKGSLSVSVCSDPDETQAKFKVAMSHSTVAVREQTNVCLIKFNATRVDGLYVFLPSSLQNPDYLSLNISLELPQVKGGRPFYLPCFLTSLPYFSQTISCSESDVTFGNVILGGFKSDIHVHNVEAEAILLRSPFGDTTGIYSVTSRAAPDDFDENDSP